MALYNIKLIVISTSYVVIFWLKKKFYNRKKNPSKVSGNFSRAGKKTIETKLFSESIFEWNNKY